MAGRWHWTALLRATTSDTGSAGMAGCIRCRVLDTAQTSSNEVLHILLYHHLCSEFSVEKCLGGVEMGGCSFSSRPVSLVLNHLHFFFFCPQGLFRLAKKKKKRPTMATKGKKRRRPVRLSQMAIHVFIVSNFFCAFSVARDATYFYTVSKNLKRALLVFHVETKNNQLLLTAA